MQNLISKLAASTLDLLFPLECFGCRTEGDVLCSSCLAGVARLNQPYCRLCAQPGRSSPCVSCQESPLDVDAIRAPFLFDGAIQEAVHALKYRNLRAAAPRLGELVGEFLTAGRIPGGVLVPVPMPSSRARQRGYNQSELLAMEVSKTTGIPMDNGLLARVRNTPPQVGTAGRAERRRNVEGSFEAKTGPRAKTDLRGAAVIVVDDVATTGSTISACASALKSAGAASVWGLVLAREA
ncbi:MAG: hypothetical protein BZY80_02370 [SAR202 cluster bacterium Io17-Chloro-G2]|nr:MAG: hypothetical protein BZY80_02370 [SAR202 cluster bacterium Io17-Chloro-G2]